MARTKLPLSKMLLFLSVFLLSNLLTSLPPYSPSVHAALTVGSSPSSYGPSTLYSGLVGWWTFDQKDTNWTTGITADRSGNGNNGQLIGMSTTTSPVAGKVGQGFTFNGSTNAVTVNAFSNIFSSYVTESMWIKTSYVVGNGVIADFRDVASSSTGFYITLDPNAGRSIGFGINNTCFSSPVTSYAPIADGQWHFIAGVYDATLGNNNLKVFYDGSLVWSVTCSVAIAGTNLTGAIGKRYLSNINYYNGRIDDVRIYNRALSAAEVAQLYHSNQATYAAPQSAAASTCARNSLNCGLVGWWTFDQKDTNWTTGITADRSGNGNNGQLISMSTTSSPVAGEVGQGLKFDGTAAYVASSSFPSTINTVTMSAWVKFIKFNANLQDGSAFEKYTKFGLRFRNSKMNFVASTSNAGWGYSTNDSNTTFKAGIWYFVSITYDGSTTRYYVNGLPDGTDTKYNGNITSGSGQMLIGQDSNNQFLNGILDDVRIYNRALSAAEVAQLYHSNQATYAAPQSAAASTCARNSLNCGLVGWWTFDQKDTNWTTGITADRSGNGNNGQLISMSTTSSPVAGEVGQGLKFDGVGIIPTGGPNVINATSTFSAWIKTTSSSRGVIYAITNTGNSTPFLVFEISGVNCTAGTIDIISRDDSFDLDNAAGSCGTIRVNDGKWHFVTATVTGNRGIAQGVTKTIYIDGVLDKLISSITFLTATTNFQSIASAEVGNTTPILNFPGSIDDVRIYNRALSAKEVSQLYLQGR